MRLLPNYSKDFIDDPASDALKILPNTYRIKLDFDHLLDQFLIASTTLLGLLLDFPLHFQPPPKLLKKPIQFKAEALRCREYFDNGLREIGGVRGRQFRLNNRTVTPTGGGELMTRNLKLQYSHSGSLLESWY